MTGFEIKYLGYVFLGISSVIAFFKKNNNSFLYIWLCWVLLLLRLLSSCSKRGLLFSVSCRLHTAAVPLRAQKLWCPGLVAHGRWNPPRPEIEPVFPALAGRFFTTGPQRKSCPLFFSHHFSGLSPCLPGAALFQSLSSGCSPVWDTPSTTPHILPSPFPFS